MSCHTVPFASADNLHEDPDSSVSEEERVRVDKVLAECREPDYWFAASRDGNREAHYRGAALLASDDLHTHSTVLGHALMLSVTA